MKLNRVQDVNQFYEQVKDYLLRDEVYNCLLLRLINTLIRNPQRYNCLPYLAKVEVGKDIVAVALRTPPHKLVLSKIENLEAVQLIAKDLYNHDEQLNGVSGLTTETQAFATAWQSLTGQPCQLSMQLQIQRLDKVQPIPRASGYLHLATAEERSLLLNWFNAFETEAFGKTGGETERTVDNFLNNKSLYFWQDGEPVSMAGGRVSIPNTGWIGPVYTPLKHRKKGYASACVAALSQTLLGTGCHFCLLFTDKANPTSNHIYQTIGYQPVADWHEYRIESRA